MPIFHSGDPIRAGRIQAAGDTPETADTLVAGDFALTGFGGSATAGSVTGTDSAFQLTITVGGTGTAYQPTCVLTFADGAWRKRDGSTFAPFAAIQRVSGSQITVGFTATTSATAMTMMLQGTAAAGETYTLMGIVRG